MSITRLSLASALALGVAAPAFAGGLTPPVVEPVVTPVVVAPVMPSSNWTGAYVGAQLGYTDLSANFTNDDGVDIADGVNYGVQAGYLYDFGSFVLGGELAYSQSQLEDEGGNEADLNIGRVLARAGYDAGSFLPYVTGGYASGELDIDGGDSIDVDAFVYGLGVDYAVTDNILVGAEYLRHDVDQLGGDDLPDGTDVFADTISLRASYQF